MADRRKQKRTSRLSIAISAMLHTVIIGVLVFIAAREGILGIQMKKIAVTMVPKEKPPEKPKEKPPEPKPVVEQPKPELPKPVETPQPEVAKSVAALPPSTTGPSAAPAATSLPGFDFEGGKAVEASSDPNVLYKGFAEYTLRSHWTRPEGLADVGYVAEVEVTVDAEGNIVRSEWKKGSGDAAWDESVRKAITATSSIGRRPPKGFPEKVLIRFDVEVPTEISL